MATVVVTQGGKSLAGATVKVDGLSFAGAELEAVALQADTQGQYGGAITLAEGVWTLNVTVEAPNLPADSAEFGFIVNCSTDGAVGSLCCGADQCSAGLECVYGACSAGPAQEGAGCYEDNECTTGNCEGNVCMPPPTCTDGCANGTESDVDCGGECPFCEVDQACNSSEDCEFACLDGVCVPGLPILGNGSHSVENVDLTVISDSGFEHNIPTSLAFHPDRTDELWVVSKGNHSMWIGNNVGTPSQTAVRKQHFTGAHFMINPSDFAFGDFGCISTQENVPSPNPPNTMSRCMATIHEEDKTTPFTDNAPGTFMGPSLWSADKDRFDGGHTTHYDMLHNSPSGMGIAWEGKNHVYWVFDGYNSALVRYDFALDHGPGGVFHDDAVVKRYVKNQVSRVPNVPSHLSYDADTDLLYVADTGNNRVAVLDATTGTNGAAIFPNFDGSTQLEVNGASITTLVDGGAVGMVNPSGLVIHDGMIFVSDNQTSRILAFTMEGDLIDYLDTDLPAGSLMGIAFDVEGRLFFVNALSNSINMVSPK
jgi:sugar lactone lactonase YvrE